MEVFDKIEDIFAGLGIKSRAEKWADSVNLRDVEE